MVSHSSPLAWRVPRTEGPGELCPWGHRVRHDRAGAETAHVAVRSLSQEAEVEQFYEDLQDLLELTPKVRMSFSSQETGMQK